MPEHVAEVAAQAATAVLSVWLGLTVLFRSRSGPGGRIFVFVTFLLFIWSASVIVQRTTSLEWLSSWTGPGNAAEDVAAFLLPPATLHIALAFATERRPHPGRTAIVVAAYAIGVLAVVQAILDPAHPITFTPPSFSALGVPGSVWAWGYAVTRLGMFALGIAWLVVALRDAGDDRLRRQQLKIAIATVALGAIGGMLRIVPEEIGGPEWIGAAIVTAAMVMAVYAVYAERVFLAPEVAARSFRYSVLVGVGLVVAFAVLVTVDSAAQRALGLQLPLVAPLALIAGVAVFEPAANWVRRVLGGVPPGGRYGALLEALGEDTVTAQRPEQAVAPALARVARTVGLRGAAVVRVDGSVLAAHGEMDGEEAPAARVPLEFGGEAFGLAIFSGKTNGLPFTDHERELLAVTCSYLAAALRLARRHREEEQALVTLSHEQAGIEAQAEQLSRRLAASTTAGLQLFVLGPLRAEIGGEPVQRWGGAKAGNRQAEALFAFLYDRGERGVDKEEAVELIWPDTDLDRADLAFHRTLLGLRRTLESAAWEGPARSSISFHNDRYRLHPDVVAWSDRTAFEALMRDAASAPDPAERMRLLEDARGLYRGDYLDDCPYYGDSAHVEETRELLRGRYADALVALAALYEATGDAGTAAAYRREALAMSGVAEAPPSARSFSRPAPAAPR
ncbi:MAG TPA: histidine kinase N-terminal 7TM domain-containing protein [Candidatus Limnocylindria bacterium]|nr:histidine kinase N-terminal 7TM domain-containing protein [Candidatus Limnocylindria bacterium]